MSPGYSVIRANSPLANSPMSDSLAGSLGRRSTVTSNGDVLDRVPSPIQVVTPGLYSMQPLGMDVKQSPVLVSIGSDNVPIQPPSYSQSALDPSSHKDIPLVVENDYGPPPLHIGAVSYIPKYNTPQPETAEENYEKAKKPKKKSASALSKTICGFFGCVCTCPMLTLMCCFSILELIFVIVFQYIALHGFDSSYTSEDDQIYWYLVPAIAATFAGVLICCVSSTFIGMSAICDRDYTKKDTYSRFTVTIVTILSFVLFISLLAVRGGLEGKSTYILATKIQNVVTASNQNVQTMFSNPGFVCAALILLFFALTLITFLVFGIFAFICTCSFWCCSSCLFHKYRKEHKQSV